MRKDKISKEAYDKAIQAYSHKPTDYAKGTVMEPTVVLGLRPSFSEYDDLGKKHTDLTNQIESLNEKMKISRQRGAFQSLQEQMKQVKELVKKREDIDAKMATLDLARKNTDDHRIATGEELSYSEKIDTVSNRIARLETLLNGG
jgi:peptidoglycan hydrolase CwlO-like protein